MHQRVLAAMGAQSVGMAITIGTQLASLPLFLSVWDTHTYGLWLVISTLPSYLAMADVGMVTAAGNRMAMSTAAGDTRDANRAFHSAQAFVALVSGTLLALMLALVLFSPWPGNATADQRIALLALACTVLLAFVCGLSEQVFKASGRFATGTLLGNFVRLGEWGGWMLGLLLGGSFAAVALGGLIVRALGTLVTMSVASQGNHGLRWGFRQATPTTVRAMLRPAAGFMAFPLANALQAQGITLVVAAVLGPAAAAIYNTMRTLVRTTVQATAIFSHSLWPEFSRMYGGGEHHALNSLVKRSAWLSAAQASAMSAALYLLAPWILQVWTRGQIAPDAILLGWLSIYAVVCGLWHVPRMLLMATNRHEALSGWSVASSAVGFALAAAMTPVVGLPGAAIGLLVGECLIAGIGMWLAARTTSVELPASKKEGASV